MTIEISIDTDDLTRIRHVATALGGLLLSRNTLDATISALVLPVLNFSGFDSGTLLVAAHRSAESINANQSSYFTSSKTEIDTVSSHEELPIQARLSQELREITGLSAATLGAALGVTREQYQRWLAGKAISTTRHGQLIYLHTVAGEVVRRLGEEQARLWWRTPIVGSATPEKLIQNRLVDRVHRLVVEIPDSMPVVNGTMMALPVQEPMTLGDYDEIAISEDDDDSWSPYDDEAGKSPR